MNTLAKEPYGPQGDPETHLSLLELRQALAELPLAPRDEGSLKLIVLRRADGKRETPQRGRLSAAQGLDGDGWARRPPRDPQAQLAVMCASVAQLIANGQPLSLYGDNLFVDLDLGADNLPIGSRLAVGDAQVVVTPEPHNGCAKFHERFGADALRFVAASATRDAHLRGIYWRVIEDGDIWVGAPIRVLSRPGA